MTDRRSDLITGLLIVLVAGVLSWNALSTGGELQDWVLVAFALGVAAAAGVFLVLKGAVLFVAGKRPSPEAEGISWSAERRAGLMALGALAYVLCLDRLGFWLASFAMLTVVYAGLKGFRSLRTWRNACVFALLVCIPAYVLFDRIFVLSLPSGIF